MVSGANGSTVTVTNRGTVKIKATQEGNANFASAPPVFQSFSVGKSILNVRVADASRVYGIPNPSLTVLYSGLKLGETSASLDVPPGIIPSLSAAAQTTITICRGIKQESSPLPRHLSQLCLIRSRLRPTGKLSPQKPSRLPAYRFPLLSKAGQRWSPG